MNFFKVGDTNFHEMLELNFDGISNTFQGFLDDDLSEF